MTIQEQIQIAEDNLNEYGQCNITLEEFNYLKDEIYSDGCLAGIELGRAEVIEEIKEYFNPCNICDCCLENDKRYFEKKCSNDTIISFSKLCEVLEQLKERK